MIGRAWDRCRLWLAEHAVWWARGVIASVRARRGREFIGDSCDAIDQRRAVYTPLDAAEERRRVRAYKWRTE